MRSSAGACSRAPVAAQVCASTIIEASHRLSCGKSSKPSRATPSSSSRARSSRPCSHIVMASAQRQAGTAGYCFTNAVSASSSSPRRPWNQRSTNNCPSAISGEGEPGTRPPSSAASPISRSASLKRAFIIARTPRKSGAYHAQRDWRRRSASATKRTISSSTASTLASPSRWFTRHVRATSSSSSSPASCANSIVRSASISRSAARSETQCEQWRLPTANASAPASPEADASPTASSASAAPRARRAGSQ